MRATLAPVEPGIALGYTDAMISRPLALLAAGCCHAPAVTPIELPAAAPGIGFDDLYFSAAHGTAFVCDPDKGRILAVRDPFVKSY
jgi:hypothetical protein